MKNKKIAVIGGGNLGIAIAEGLINSDLINAKNITVTRRKLHLIEHLKEKSVHIERDNIKATTDADIIIIAVKPHQIENILKEISPSLKPDNILISVVTGFSLSTLTSVVGNQASIFRAMPNTAIAIQESMTCISTKNGSEEQKKMVLSIFNKLGKAIIIEDELMASATVLGACGIAYSLRFIRAASQGGIEIGFDAKTAQLIAAQTVNGAASLLIKRGEHPEKEIDRVTTPQGCTIAGLNEMEHQGFSSALIKGIIASYKAIDKV